MHDIDIDHFLWGLLRLHLQLHLVVMLYWLLLDLKVDAVGGIRWILLNIHYGFVFELLALLLDSGSF